MSCSPLMWEFMVLPKRAGERIPIAFARRNLGSALTNEKFPSLIKKLWETGGIVEQNVKSGFSTCGLCPFDPRAIPVSALEATEVFQKPIQADLNNNTTTGTEDQQPEHASLPGPSTESKPPKDAADTDSLSDEVQFVPPTSPVSSTRLSGGSTPTSFRPSTPSRKEYVVQQLPPLLVRPEEKKAKKKGMDRAVKRSFGESLSSEECYNRLLKDAEGRNNKKMKKTAAQSRKGKTVRCHCHCFGLP